jgi:putative membrane protein
VLTYSLARVSQLYADKLPTLLIVILHVVPPAAFALIHGSILYRLRGVLIFTAFCLGIPAACETVGLRTGFPFGHYYFTNVMGPKILDLPLLLVLAYLGIGYVAWVLALVVLGYREKPMRKIRLLAVPILASFFMCAWDLSMEPDWSTLDRAWIWKDGGAFFGVPLSNFFGWYLTSYLFYQAFALYSSSLPAPPRISARPYWSSAILIYAICGSGNLLIVALPMAPPLVRDATGHAWMTKDLVETCALMSLLVMLPMALLAWLRVVEDESQVS